MRRFRTDRDSRCLFARAAGHKPTLLVKEARRLGNFEAYPPATQIRTNSEIQTMDWTDLSFNEHFIGRVKELSLIERELIYKDARFVSITGDAGIGKTSLALMFAQNNSSAFPGGVFHIHAIPFEHIATTVSACASSIDQKHLLILDDMQRMDPIQRNEDVAVLLQIRPSARVIFLSREQDSFEQKYLSLHLSGLSTGESHQLLRALETSDALIESVHSLLGGNPLSAQMFAEHSKTTMLTPRQVIQLLHSTHHSGLIDPNGRPLGRGTREEIKIISDISFVSDDLLAKAHANPTLLHEISPRRFEEFVADLLDRLGYEVTLTPASKDGGKDIYAARKDHLGSFLYIVECKKYSPDHRVGVGLVRELNGVVQAERATAGILATTSFFTKGAKEFQERLSHQISLKDYLGLQEWIRNAFQRKH